MNTRRIIELTALAACVAAAAFGGGTEDERDARIERFLESSRGDWRDLNVPWEDGNTLFQLITGHGYTRALEIGTSTGHSSIWIARGLRKTGGRLITIEIDPGRRKEALANFEAAGVADIIDSRLGDAHEIVRELEGPFDFVFSDADKEGYTDYLQVLLPKLTVGGCFTAHNVSARYAGIGEFLDTLAARPELDTTIDRSSTAGLSISYKAAEETK